MGTTPKALIPYIEPTDLLANYPTQDKAQADRLEAILFPTTWTAITANYAGTIFYRMIGSIVFLQIDVTGTFNSGTVYTFGVVPTAIKPLRTARGSAETGLYVAVCNVSSASGNISFRQMSGASQSAAQATLVYSIG